MRVVHNANWLIQSVLPQRRILLFAKQCVLDAVVMKIIFNAVSSIWSENQTSRLANLIEKLGRRSSGSGWCGSWLVVSLWLINFMFLMSCQLPLPTYFARTWNWHLTSQPMAGMKTERNVTLVTLTMIDWRQALSFSILNTSEKLNRVCSLYSFFKSTFHFSNMSNTFYKRD